MAEAPSIPAKQVFRKEILEEWAPRWGELRSVTALRRRALELFREFPLPDDVAHLWRYTRPERLLPSSLPEEGPAPREETPSLEEGVFLRLLPGGRFLARREGEAARKGVRVFSLSQVPPSRSLLGTLVPPGRGIMEALNGAFWTAGLFLEVPPDTVLEEPLRIQVPAGKGTRLSRIAVRLGPRARAVIQEEHAGGGEGGRVISVTELQVGRDASLSWLLFQDWNEGVSGHITQRAAIEEQGELFTLFGSLGGDCYKADLGARLQGSGAVSVMTGFSFGEGRRHMDHHTEQRHLAGGTRSDMDIRTVLAGESRGVYTGLIRIEEGCPGTEAFQEARGLLLSRKARAEAIPELEILTDDVRCSHGAALSPVPEEEIFYLGSRGLPREEALRLLVKGFFQASLDRVPADLRGPLERRLDERIERTRR